MPTKRKQHTPGNAQRSARTRTSKGGFSTSRATSSRVGSHARSSSAYNTRSGAGRVGGTGRVSSTRPSARGGMVGNTLSGSGRTGNGKRGFAASLPQPTLTRRNLLIGAGALVGVAAVGGGASAAINALDASSSDNAIESISVSEGDVEATDDYTQVELSDHVKSGGSWKLAYGTQVWADNDTVAACLVPAETSSPLNTVELLYLSSGHTGKVLSAAQGADEGFEIFDVRASESGMVWTEANTYEGTWRIYTAQTGNGSAEAITLVDEGDSNWMTPSIAAVGNAAFWQVIPTTDGENAKDESVIRAVKFGKEKYKKVCTSKRAFATRVTPATDGVVVTPRADSTSIYYTLTKISADDFSVVDEMTLPSSMTPNMVGYGPSGFAFAFSSIYSYGGGIANLGTYTPRSKVKANNYDDLQWFHFARTPLASPCWAGNWFVVKSTTTICGVNFANKCYFVTDNVSGSDDYGEYLVSSGTCSKFVGLSQVEPDGEDAYAQVRVFNPIDGSVSSLFA